MTTIINSPNYQMLVECIQETFKGSEKVAEVQSSLHTLFTQFEEHVGNQSTSSWQSVGQNGGERHDERGMLVGVITVLLQHLIKDQNNTIQMKTIDHFLQSLKMGVDQTVVISKLMHESHKSTSIMNRVREMFEADDVTDEDVDSITRSIGEYLRSSYTENNQLSKQLWNFDFDENDRASIERLSSGWEKNRHELQKRTQKFENFREESNTKLEQLERSIEESKNRNQDFRKSLNDTSDRISNLIEELHDTAKKSEFLQKEIEIIDSTVTDMETYKHKTHIEHAELENQLFEKRNSLIDFLKKIDCNLDESLSKHQRIIERHDTFNEALEDLAECYSNFEYQEQQILRKYNIKPIHLQIDKQRSQEIDTESIRFAIDERDDAIRKLEFLSKQNSSLSGDVEDLFNLNTKLSDENTELKERLCEFSTVPNDANDTNELENLRSENEELLRARNESLKTADSNAKEMQCLQAEMEKLQTRNEHLETANIKTKAAVQDNKDLVEELRTNIENLQANNSGKELDELRTENEKLRSKNVNLQTVNAKTQDVLLENKELLEETAQLQDDIDKLETQIKELTANQIVLEESRSSLALQNESLECTLQNVNATKQSRVLHIKTNMADIILHQNSSSNKTTGNDSDSKTEQSLEAMLQNEHDRNVTLESINRKQQNTVSTLSNIYRKIGIDNLQSETSYNISIQSEAGTHVFSSSGITLTKKEMDTFKTRRNGDAVTKAAEENMVDELSNMLQESYQHSDDLKLQNKLLLSQSNNLRLELAHKEESRYHLTPPQKPIPKHHQSALDGFIGLFNEMGIPHLQYGATYSIHYQVISSTGSSRRTSYTFQHSVNAINFDNIKDLLVSIGTSKPSPICPSPKPSRKISRTPILHTPVNEVDLNLSTLQNDVEDNLQKDTKFQEIRPVLAIANSGNASTRELERLLRIAKRDNEELIKTNRNLRRDLSSVKDNKERFLGEQKKHGKEFDGSKNYEDEMKAEDFKDLQHAYDLSDANCTFLEKQNKQLEDRFQQVESVVELYKNELFDKNEEFECSLKETKESMKKSVECQRQMDAMKQEIEYLETDVEYLKAKLTEAGIDHPIHSGLHIYPARMTAKDSAITVDFEALLIEKNSLVLECESLAAKIKFLEAENRFALEEARLIHKQHEDDVVETCVEVLEDVVVTRDKSNSFIEREVKSEGLAKRFKALQKEHRHLQEDHQSIVQDKKGSDQKIELLEVEVDVLKSTNRDLTEKIVELEKSVLLNKDENSVVRIQLDGESNSIDDRSSDTDERLHATKGVSGSHQDINTELLAADVTKKQLEVLTEKVNNLENENTVLKIESMKQRGGKRQSMSRKISQAGMKMFELSLFDQSTQTEQGQPPIFSNCEVQPDKKRELQSAIDVLSKTNAELETSLHGQNKRMEVLEKEVKHLEDINMKVLQRNTSLKEKLETKTKQEDEATVTDSDLSDEQGFGINLFFKNDILSEYEKAELEEEIKTLRYENQLMKQDLMQKTEIEKNLQGELRQVRTQIVSREEVRDSTLRSNGLDEQSDVTNDNRKFQHKIEELTSKISALEKEKDSLSHKNHENTATIEQLERQLLFGEKISNLAQQTHDETGNTDLFSERFLLRSEMPIDKTTTQEEIQTLEELSLQGDAKVRRQKAFTDSCSSSSDCESDEHEHMVGSEDKDDGKAYARENVSYSKDNSISGVKIGNSSSVRCDIGSIKEDASDSDQETDFFKECIKEGELTSEMEDFFRKYSENSSSFSSPVIGDDKGDDIVFMTKVTNIDNPPLEAKIVGKPGRFRSKEDLEETIENQEHQIREMSSAVELSDESKILLENRVKDLKKEVDSLTKDLLVSQQTFMEISLSLNDRLDEVNHHKQRNEELENAEERLSGDIQNLEVELEKKDQDLVKLENCMKEYKYKIEASTKECDGYKAILEEQERLLKNTHENSTLMQKSINDLNKEVNEKDESIKELEEQKLSLSVDFETLVGERNSSQNESKKLAEERETFKNKLSDATSENAELREQVHEVDMKFIEMKETLLVKDENIFAFERERAQLEKNFTEQEVLISRLREKVRDYEDVIALYEERNARRNSVFEDGTTTVVDDDTCVVNENNISFEIQQASIGSKTATEMSFENASITLPEIQVRKYSKDVSSAGGHIARCNSLPNPAAHIADKNALFPTKYFEPPNTGLSEVSDMEENNEQDDNYSSEYVQKLKKKLKTCTSKVRDRNKIIQNQNEDIDNFLEDIASKERLISILRDETNLFRQQQGELRDQINELHADPDTIEGGLCDVKAPSLNSTTESNLTRELIELAEECCHEIDHLQHLVVEAPSSVEFKELQRKLHISYDKVNRLCAKLTKCVELGLISPSISREERDIYPNIHEIPGKTVNEIKTENELLNVYNQELKQEIEELREQLLNGDIEPPLHSSMFQENNDVIEAVNNDVSAVIFGEHDIDSNKDQLAALTSEVKELSSRLQTAESQIEKDWEIIESQGSQLDNLHQQYIKQRDENIKHQRLIGEKDAQIEKMMGDMHKQRGSNEQDVHIEQHKLVVNEQRDQFDQGISDQHKHEDTNFMEQDTHLADLYIKLTEQQEEIHNYQELILKKDQELLQLAEEIVELEQICENNNKEIEKLEGTDKHVMSYDSLDQIISHQQQNGNSNSEIMFVDVDQLEDQHQKQILSYQEKVAVLEDRVSGMQDQHQADMGQLQEDYQQQIQKLRESLENKEMKANKLSEDIKDVRQRAKVKEEELERILLEKEDGIEKLHSMIRELEKSLSNSQVHIEGILRESIDNRESEEAKDHLIKEQDNLNAYLQQQLDNSQKQKAAFDSDSWKAQLIGLSSCMDKTKTGHTDLREQVNKMQTDYRHYITTIMTQLQHYLENISETLPTTRRGEDNPEMVPAEENNGSVELLSPASSDSESLFIPRQSSGDSFNQSLVDGGSRSSDGSLWSVKYRKHEKEKQQLIERHQEILKRKDSAHKLQIDTIIRSLAKRHIRKPRPFLTPSPELFSGSTEHLEHTEFLKNCLSKVKYSSDGY